MAGGRAVVHRMTGSAGGRRGRILVAGVAALLVVVALGLGLLHLRDQQIGAARADAVAAAREAVPQLLSYDHRTIDGEVDARTARLTGPFKDQYANLLRTVVLPAAHKSRLITTTEVQAAGTMSEDGPDRVTVLLFVNQSTGPEGQPPNVAGSRVRVTMERPAEDWLVSEVTPV